MVDGWQKSIFRVRYGAFPEEASGHSADISTREWRGGTGCNVETIGILTLPCDSWPNCSGGQNEECDVDGGRDWRGGARTAWQLPGRAGGESALFLADISLWFCYRESTITSWTVVGNVWAHGFLATPSALRGFVKGLGAGPREHQQQTWSREGEPMVSIPQVRLFITIEFICFGVRAVYTVPNESPLFKVVNHSCRCSTSTRVFCWGGGF